MGSAKFQPLKGDSSPNAKESPRTPILGGVMLEMGRSGVWDPDSLAYKCLCGVCHVRTGAVIIGILEALRLGVELCTLILFINMQANGFLAAGMVGVLGSAALLGLFFYGLAKERSCFVLPHLVQRGLLLIFRGFVCAAMMVSLALGNGHGAYLRILEPALEDESKKGGHSVVAIGVFLLFAAFAEMAVSVWFFLVVLKAYRFLKDKATYGRVGQQTIYTAAPAPFGNTHMVYPPGYAYGPNPNPPPAYESKE